LDVTSEPLRRELKNCEEVPGYPDSSHRYAAQVTDKRSSQV